MTNPINQTNITCRVQGSFLELDRGRQDSPLQIFCGLSKLDITLYRRSGLLRDIKRQANQLSTIVVLTKHYEGAITELFSKALVPETGKGARKAVNQLLDEAKACTVLEELDDILKRESLLEDALPTTFLRRIAKAGNSLSGIATHELRTLLEEHGTAFAKIPKEQQDALRPELQKAYEQVLAEHLDFLTQELAGTSLFDIVKELLNPVEAPGAWAQLSPLFAQRSVLGDAMPSTLLKQFGFFQHGSHQLAGPAISDLLAGSQKAYHGLDRDSQKLVQAPLVQAMCRVLERQLELSATGSLEEFQLSYEAAIRISRGIEDDDEHARIEKIFAELEGKYTKCIQDKIQNLNRKLLNPQRRNSAEIISKSLERHLELHRSLPTSIRKELRPHTAQMLCTGLAKLLRQSDVESLPKAFYSLFADLEKLMRAVPQDKNSKALYISHLQLRKDSLPQRIKHSQSMLQELSSAASDLRQNEAEFSRLREKVSEGLLLLYTFNTEERRKAAKTLHPEFPKLHGDLNKGYSEICKFYRSEISKDGRTFDPLTSRALETETKLRKSQAMARGHYYEIKALLKATGAPVKQVENLETEYERIDAVFETQIEGLAAKALARVSDESLTLRELAILSVAIGELQELSVSEETLNKLLDSGSALVHKVANFCTQSINRGCETISKNLAPEPLKALDAAISAADALVQLSKILTSADVAEDFLSLHAEESINLLMDLQDKALESALSTLEADFSQAIQSQADPDLQPEGFIQDLLHLRAQLNYILHRSLPLDPDNNVRGRIVPLLKKISKNLPQARTKLISEVAHQGTAVTARSALILQRNRDLKKIGEGGKQKSVQEVFIEPGLHGQAQYVAKRMTSKAYHDERVVALLRPTHVVPAVPLQTSVIDRHGLSPYLQDRYYIPPSTLCDVDGRPNALWEKLNESIPDKITKNLAKEHAQQLMKQPSSPKQDPHSIVQLRMPNSDESPRSISVTDLKALYEKGALSADTVVDGQTLWHHIESRSKLGLILARPVTEGPPQSPGIFVIDSTNLTADSLSRVEEAIRSYQGFVWRIVHKDGKEEDVSLAKLHVYQQINAIDGQTRVSALRYPQDKDSDLPLALTTVIPETTVAELASASTSLLQLLQTRLTFKATELSVASDKDTGELRSKSSGRRVVTKPFIPGLLLISDLNESIHKRILPQLNHRANFDKCRTVARLGYVDLHENNLGIIPRDPIIKDYPSVQFTIHLDGKSQTLTDTELSLLILSGRVGSQTQVVIKTPASTKQAHPCPESNGSYLLADTQFFKAWTGPLDFSLFDNDQVLPESNTFLFHVVNASDVVYGRAHKKDRGKLQARLATRSCILQMLFKDLPFPQEVIDSAHIEDSTDSDLRILRHLDAPIYRRIPKKERAKVQADLVKILSSHFLSAHVARVREQQVDILVNSPHHKLWRELDRALAKSFYSSALTKTLEAEEICTKHGITLVELKGLNPELAHCDPHDPIAADTVIRYPYRLSASQNRKQRIQIAQELMPRASEEQINALEQRKNRELEFYQGYQSLAECKDRKLEEATLQSRLKDFLSSESCPLDSLEKTAVKKLLLTPDKAQEALEQTLELARPSYFNLERALYPELRDVYRILNETPWPEGSYSPGKRIGDYRTPLLQDLREAFENTQTSPEIKDLIREVYPRILSTFKPAERTRIHGSDWLPV